MADESKGNDNESPSTGFLPLTLALTLFIAGLFVLGVIPMDCGASPPPAT